MDNYTPEGKACLNCKQVKPITDFYLRSSKSDKRIAVCRDCANERAHKYAPIQCNIDPSITRQCTTCRETYPATAEFYHRKRNGSYGLSSTCKRCASNYKSARQFQPVNHGEKACRVCHQMKPATIEFYYRSACEVDGLGGICIECEKVRSRAWRERDENKQAARNRARKWYTSNRSRHKTNVQRWLQNNTERAKQISINRSRRRRSKLRNLPDNFTDKQWQNCLNYFSGCCAACGRQLFDLFGNLSAHQDHWIPVDNLKCPGSVATNIVCLCGGSNGCNNSKGSTDPDNWLIRKFGSRKAKDISRRINQYFEWVKQQE